MSNLAALTIFYSKILDCRNSDSRTQKMSVMSETIGEFKNETRNKQEYERKYVEWRIPGIFELIENKEYISPFFYTIDNYSSWYLGLCLNIKPGLISVDIRNPCELAYAYSVEYCFGLKNCDGIVEDLECGILTGNIVYSDWKNLIEKELLQRKTELAPSDILTVTCTLKWKPESIIPYSQEQTVSEKEKSLKLTRLDKLSENFKDLYADKDTCDITLKVRDIEFKAHRLLLMARSSVFAATFKHDTLERQTGVINIPDCDPDSFQEFLEYLYSGKLEELSFCSALNLYYTSEKYDVQELKAFCIECLTQCLTVESVCEIVLLAAKYNEAELFSVVQCFFNKKYADILLTSEWERLLNSDCGLANKLLTEMAKMKRNI